MKLQPQIKNNVSFSFDPSKDTILLCLLNGKSSIELSREEMISLNYAIGKHLLMMSQKDK
jgi:hypothetical protein